MSTGCDATDRLKGILRKMAASKVQEGHTDPDVILQHIHDAVAEHTPLERSEIADILVGHVDHVQQPNRTDLQRRIDAFHRELKDIRGRGEEGTIAKLESDIERIDKQLAGITTRQKIAKQQGPLTEEAAGLKAELAAKKKELAAANALPKQDKNFLKNKARQGVITKEIAKLEGRLARGDYRKSERQTYAKTTETEKAEGELTAVRMKIDAARRKAELAERGLSSKIADTIVDMHRAAVLTSINVGLKLPATAFTNIFIRSLLLEPVGKGLSKLPYIRGIAELARTEGNQAPFLKTEGTALKRAGIDMWKAMADMTTTGTHDVASKYGGEQARQEHQSDLALARVIGNIHGALKVPALLNHFHRSVEQIMFTEAKAMKKADVHDDIIADHLASADTKARIGAEAFLEAKREIFQNDNAFSAVYEVGMSWLHKHGTGTKASKGVEGKTGNPVAFTIEKGMRYLQPITKVPTNIVIAGGGYAAGALHAITHIALAAHQGRLDVKAGAADLGLWKNMLRGLRPEQANSIMRNLKRQLVGAAAMAVGAYYFENLGGLYSYLLNKDPDKPEDETIELFGHEISKQVLEHPLLAVMQMGATIARVLDRPGHGDTEPSVLEGVWEVSKAMGTRIPQIGMINDFSRDTSLNGVQKWAARQVASMNPQMMQWVARNLDREDQDPRAIALAEQLEKYGGLHGKAVGLAMRMTTGEKVKRKSEDWVDEFKQGVPENPWIPSRVDLEEKRP